MERYQVYVYELDQNGYLSKETTYDKNGKKIGETELILDKNRLVKYSDWNLYSIGKYSFEQKYEGKSGSYLLETTNVKGEKTYLTQKKQHRIVTTYSSSRVKSEEKLNRRGNTVSKTTYNEDGTTNKVFYKYGRKGEVISMKIIEQNNTTVVFKHNRKGDYIINQMDNTKRFVKYTEFDKKGNWIKSITYEDDEPIIVTKRDIMYR